MLTISLDVEGVLSNTHAATYEHADDLDSSYQQEWGFPSEELYDEFMHVSQNLWHNHHEEIPPMEDPVRLHHATKDLRDYGHTVDIVTHRHNVDDQIKTWLDEQGIFYDDFHAPSVEKDELDYDFYVDDKPSLAERIATDPERVIALRDKPYNEHIEDTYRVERIESLEHVAFMLTTPETVEHLERLTDPSVCSGCGLDVTVHDNTFCEMCQPDVPENAAC